MSISIRPGIYIARFKLTFEGLNGIELVVGRFYILASPITRLLNKSEYGVRNALTQLHISLHNAIYSINPLIATLLLKLNFDSLKDLSKMVGSKMCVIWPHHYVFMPTLIEYNNVVVATIAGAMEGHTKDIRLNKGGFGRSCGWSYHHGPTLWSDGCYMIGKEAREVWPHTFHMVCIDKWFLRMQATCPICRDPSFISHLYIVHLSIF
ncbi:hypothetical protein YC2023_030516 [Brassica napus]